VLGSTSRNSSSRNVSVPGVSGRNVEDSTLALSVFCKLLSLDNDFSMLSPLSDDLETALLWEISRSHSMSSSFMLDSRGLLALPEIGVEEIGMFAGMKSADNKTSPDVQFSKGTHVLSERRFCKMLLRSMLTFPRKSSLPMSSSNTSTNNSRGE
jgi:hypothetical protein